MANLHTSHEICKFLIQVLKFISKDNFAFYLEVADESRFKDDQIFSTKKLFHTFSTKKLLEVAGSGESRWQGCDKCSLPPDCHDCHDDGHCTIIWRQHNNILNLMSKWAKWPPAFTSREYKHFNWNLLCAAVSLPAGVMSEWFNKDTSGDSSCHVIVLIHLYIDTDWLLRLKIKDISSESNFMLCNCPHPSFYWEKQTHLETLTFDTLLNIQLLITFFPVLFGVFSWHICIFIPFPCFPYALQTHTLVEQYLRVVWKLMLFLHPLRRVQSHISRKSPWVSFLPIKTGRKAIGWDAISRNSPSSSFTKTSVYKTWSCG